MGSAGIHCINCGAETSDESGRAKCSACQAEFEFTRIAAKPVNQELAYASPDTDSERRKSKFDWCWWIALVASLAYRAFPLIAASAIWLAIVELRRVRKTGDRGTGHAVTAIVLSVIGIGAFFLFLQGLQKSREPALNVACMSNLRQIGIGIMMYENSNPRARGYTMDEVMPYASLPSTTKFLSCPNVEIPSDGKRIPTYLMLTSLQPFRRLSDPSGTVIAIELHTHHVPARDDLAAINGINALFGDGHVESLPVEQAAGIIERSLLAQQREPATRPSSSPASRQVSGESMLP